MTIYLWIMTKYFFLLEFHLDDVSDCFCLDLMQVDRRYLIFP